MHSSLSGGKECSAYDAATSVGVISVFCPHGGNYYVAYECGVAQKRTAAKPRRNATLEAVQVRTGDAAVRARQAIRSGVLVFCSVGFSVVGIVASALLIASCELAIFFVPKMR